MRSLIQIAIVATLAVTGSYVAAVHFRDTPPIERQGAEARPADGPPVATQSSAPVRHPARAADPADGARRETIAPDQPSPATDPGRDGTAAATAPTFDIVRVSPTGEAVIAGRAEPESRIHVTDREGVIGTVESDRRGEWVLVPAEPLRGGTREIGVEAERRDGTTTKSDSVVVVSVPEAAGGATEPDSPMAVSVPRDGLGPSRLFQRPAPDAGEPPPRDDAGDTAVAGAPGSGRGSGDLASAAPSGPAETAAVEQGERPSTSRATAGTARTGGQSARIASVGPSHDSTGASAVERRDSSPIPDVAVETVDYDEAGNVALSGAAPPGSRVQVFIDDSPIGATDADESGRWEMTPDRSLAPGRYTLRVDQLAGDGRVVARIRLPFSRAEAFRDFPPGTLAVVQPGNSLWRIARRTYGDGRRFTVIYEANSSQIHEPDLIYPGQVFSLPDLEGPREGR